MRLGLLGFDDGICTLELDGRAAGWAGADGASSAGTGIGTVMIFLVLNGSCIVDAALAR